MTGSTFAKQITPEATDFSPDISCGRFTIQPTAHFRLGQEQQLPGKLSPGSQL